VLQTRTRQQDAIADLTDWTKAFVAWLHAQEAMVVLQVMAMVVLLQGQVMAMVVLLQVMAMAMTVQ
jgi:hypothetical protein